MSVSQVEERLAGLLTSAEREKWLSREELAGMRELVSAGEPGVALENFCTQLEEYDIAVPDPVARELEELPSMMGMPISPWISRRP